MLDVEAAYVACTLSNDPVAKGLETPLGVAKVHFTKEWNIESFCRFTDDCVDDLKPGSVDAPKVVNRLDYEVIPSIYLVPAQQSAPQTEVS